MPSEPAKSDQETPTGRGGWWASGAVFVTCWIGYIAAGHAVAAGSRAYTLPDDCILTLDVSSIVKMITDPGASSSYRSTLHPFFSVLLSPLVHLFGYLCPDFNRALLTAQAFIASIGVTCLQRTLRLLRFQPVLQASCVTLYAGSFSMLLFTSYPETYVVSGASVALLYYLFLAHPEWSSCTLGGVGMAMLSVSGSISNFSHYLVMIACGALRSRRLRNIVAAPLNVAVSIACIFTVSCVLKAAGFVGSALDMLGRQATLGYSFINYTYPQARIGSIEDLVRFALDGLSSWAAYRELFSNIFYAPLIGTPLSIGQHLIWSHNCTVLDSASMGWQWYVALLLLVPGMTGLWEALRRGNLFYRAVAIAYLGNVGFYGFFFLRASSYFYALNFLSLYVLLIASGMHRLCRACTSSTARIGVHALFSALVLASVCHSVHQLRTMHAFALSAPVDFGSPRPAD